MQKKVLLLTISLACTGSQIVAMDYKTVLATIRKEREERRQMMNQTQRQAALDTLRNRPSEVMVEVQKYMEQIISGEKPNKCVFIPASQFYSEPIEEILTGGITLMLLSSYNDVVKVPASSNGNMPAMTIVGPMMLLSKYPFVDGPDLNTDLLFKDDHNETTH